LAFEAKRGSVFLDGGLTAPKEYSEETAREIDQEVARIIHETYARVRDLLTKRRDDLERLARRLLDKEVVEGEELRAMLGTSPATSPA
jgi:cell division protease FtsH